MKINYNYGLLKENSLVYAPNIIFDGNVQIINATAEKYAENGYLPIERTEQPESVDGFYFTPIYTETDGKIVQEWEQHEIPVTDEATKADYINALEDLGVNFDE